MVKLHEEYIVDENGRRSAVILRLREYQQLLELLEDLADRQYIKEHRKEGRISLAEFEKQLGG